MNIQIDVDGVLANFTKGFYREANKYIPSLPSKAMIHRSHGIIKIFQMAFKARFGRPLKHPRHGGMS
jgi:hypothetical protein